MPLAEGHIPGGCVSRERALMWGHCGHRRVTSRLDGPPTGAPPGERGGGGGAATPGDR